MKLLALITYPVTSDKLGYVQLIIRVVGQLQTNVGTEGDELGAVAIERIS